uniref:hypothetical protein n=1 Tax=Myxococcus qinghaiensis TaxID=2906758 RepID=UPI003898E87A
MPGLTTVVAVVGGGAHSMALKVDGTVWAWGQNAFGQLGDGTTTRHPSAVQVLGMSNVTAVAGGTALPGVEVGRLGVGLGRQCARPAGRGHDDTPGRSGAGGGACR